MIRQARFHGQFQHGMDFLYIVSTLEHVCGQSACGQNACGPNAQTRPKLRADSSHAYMHTCLHAYMLTRVLSYTLTCISVSTVACLHAFLLTCFHVPPCLRVCIHAPCAYMLLCASMCLHVLNQIGFLRSRGIKLRSGVSPTEAIDPHI